MKAWEQSRQLLRTAEPVVLDEDAQNWEEGADVFAEKQDAEIAIFWRSNVPGSGALDSCAIAAIGALENKGYELPPYEEILAAGFTALDAGDMPALHMAHFDLWNVLRAARPDPGHPAQQTRRYADWESFEADVDWPAAGPVELGQEYRNRIAAGWWGQIIGAAAGTALEGYTAGKLAAKFGRITDYVRKPNTFNDDITYEICFLEAYGHSGPQVTSAEIARQWVGLVPFGWSAEGVALNHLQRGVLPPYSGSIDNPFDEWIGAQMRGAICGMVAPGDAKEAARLAWIDGRISHTSNGILGEVFNAVLCARAFVQDDIRQLTQDVVGLIPAETEYGGVCRFALDACRTAGDWRSAWAVCDEEYQAYHWIHAYPNIAAQIVALWFGHEDFDLMCEIICSIGHDADCNAAQILCAFGIAKGQAAIPQRWIEPIGTRIVTYMRRPKEIEFDALVDMTVDAARKWN